MDKTIILNSDSGLRIGGLTDQTDPTAKTAVSTATVTGRIYDRKKYKPLLLETDGDGLFPLNVTVQLKSVEPYVDGEVFQLLLDDGLLHNTTISSRDLDLDTITMAAAVPTGKIAPAFSYAKRQLGPDVAMVLYGDTPAPSVDTWGYAGPVSDTHEGLYHKLKVWVEVTADDGVGKRSVFSWKATVVRG